ncbi:hypothetical protein [Paenibacillus beijingensis]|uniref:Uncharacterized protein n=1 Tax=Paenibacillus beijingensis TaxID=1126833 RepID=A0A0D5NFN7_9BACL|nr:hypothetical protein [Paenibacillus beijingensis]AJY73965.1 hypothetical protein VN24_04225 [Paenibacillus beijingensis]
MENEKYAGYDSNQFRQDLADFKKQQELLDLKLLQLRNRIRDISDERESYLTDLSRELNQMVSLKTNLEEYVAPFKA